MKTVSIALLFLLSSCSTVSYFESPNSLRNINGNLYLQNGKVMEGKLVVQRDNLFGTPVKLYLQNEKDPMHFRLQEVKGYEIDGNRYELKEIRESFSIGRSIFFMRKLTAGNGKMHLYEHMRKETINKTKTRFVHEYYVQLPDESTAVVYSHDSPSAAAKLHQKISAVLQNCPLLDQKIKNKEEGYSYPLSTFQKRKEVQALKQIIDEYNKCEIVSGK